MMKRVGNGNDGTITYAATVVSDVVAHSPRLGRGQHDEFSMFKSAAGQRAPRCAVVLTASVARGLLAPAPASSAQSRRNILQRSPRLTRRGGTGCRNEGARARKKLRVPAATTAVQAPV